MSIAALKEKLQAFNIDTATPGLTGADRLNELKLRLEMAQTQKGGRSWLAQDEGDEDGLNGSDSGIDAWPGSSTGPGLVPSLANLTMSELRGRLEALNVDTRTPGLTGAERREELMRRLIKSICGGDQADQAVTDSHLDAMLEGGSLLGGFNGIVTDANGDSMKGASKSKGRAPPDHQNIEALRIEIPSIEDSAELEVPVQLSDEVNPEEEITEQAVDLPSPDSLDNSVARINETKRFVSPFCFTLITLSCCNHVKYGATNSSMQRN